MMNTPLLMKQLFEYSQTYFPRKEIVSRTTQGVFRYTYKDFGNRVRRLSSALAKLGVARGDRVGTFAWNHHRHLEAYFAVPCMGAVLHTINLRLSPEHLTYIVNHAEDKVLLIDESLLPLLESLRDKMPSVQAFIIMSDSQGAASPAAQAGSGAAMQPASPSQPAATSSASRTGQTAAAASTTLQPAYFYEDLLLDADPTFPYPDDLDDTSPMGMCYTSATTGNPKGVIYSHRGTYLHSMVLGLANTFGLSERDAVLPIVPMFHANAWGFPFAAVWFGAKMVLPGPAPTPRNLIDLMVQEGVTLGAGVPTVWLGVLRELDEHPQKLPLRTILCGGSAAPPALIQAYEERHKIPFAHAYGMTETSPLATFARMKSYQEDLSPEERLGIRATQGMLVPGLEMRLMKDGGDAAWDGQEMGELLLRGPWIADEYYNDSRSREAFQEGWLRTGDVATVDDEGFVKLVDRTKDLVKSGGEWISSVDLENALMAHPAVFEAAVVGVPHEKWDERPLAFVVFKPGQSASKEDLLEFLRSRFAKWWVPDDVLVIDEVPKTSVGKFMKRSLREQYHRHYLGE